MRGITCGIVLLIGIASWSTAAAQNQSADDVINGATDDVTNAAVDSKARAAAKPLAAAQSNETSAASGPSRESVVVTSLTVFALAVFVGFLVITKVPPTLHTPLMSGSNAISGITIVGALLVAGGGATTSSTLGAVAVALAMINVVGGFLVTHRMLAMFQKRK